MKENLKTDKLSYILKQIQDWPLTTGLSDMELASLTRIYIAFHNMVVSVIWKRNSVTGSFIANA